MTDRFPTLADLSKDEAELQLTHFDNADAWHLGLTLVEMGREASAPIAIDIRRNGHQLFHCALPGASPDNAAWIERKGRVVRRFGHSSLYMGQLCRDAETTLQEKFGLDPALYAPYGGAFPLLIKTVGPIGVVGVSGLPQVEDHGLVTSALRRVLNRE